MHRQHVREHSGSGLCQGPKRAIVEVGQITITDGGPDGLNGTTPNTLFETQGIFIP